jgi:hypothetical protein
MRGLIRSVTATGDQRRHNRDILRRAAVIQIVQRLGIALAELAGPCRIARDSDRAGRAAALTPPVSSDRKH